MREAWFVVEVYCFLNIVKGMAYIKPFPTDPMLSAIGLGGTLAVIMLSYLTFRGKRMAVRMLSMYIIFGVFTAGYEEITDFQRFDVYMLYRLIVSAYFLIGALKLWRIKELPTRFTDLPTKSPTHG